jgi:hypothetical protein
MSYRIVPNSGGSEAPFPLHFNHWFLVDIVNLELNDNYAIYSLNNPHWIYISLFF